MLTSPLLKHACLTSIGVLTFVSGAMAAEAIGPGSSSGTDVDLGAFEAKSDAQAASILEAFAKLDANTDGQITRSEAHPDRSLTRQFHALDRNRDGSLSPEEFATR